MIAELSKYVSSSFADVSGKVFCSGRSSFRQRGGIYVLGYNPGGDPETHGTETVSRHTNYVMSDAPDRWSAYMDEVWQGRGSVMQTRMQYLFRALKLDPRQVPSSNLIFTRSRRGADLKMKSRELINLCWKFHAEVIKQLQPAAIICLGSDCGSVVRTKVGGGLIDTLSERYEGRSWASYAWQRADCPAIIQITHPSVADWTNAAADPVPMIRRVMEH